MVAPSAARSPEPANPYGAVNPPIVRSSTFTYPSGKEGARRFAVAGGAQNRGEPGLFYSRMENPTVVALETHIAKLEGAEACVATASGMGAIFTAFMGHLKPGARVVADPCVYGCTHTLLQKLGKWGIQVTHCDTSDPAQLEAAIGKHVDLVFLETPMNPTLRLVDIQRAARLTHRAGGILVVDNTFATPAVQKPLALGADLVVHSLTKAINGHSDLLAGAVVGSTARLAPVREWRKDAGAVLDPDTAWHVLRGAQTLEVRSERANGSALALARALAAEGLPVSHPLLATHPDHAIAQAQMPGGCCVLTLDLGTESAAMLFQDRLKLFQRAVSLGGYESLVSHPWSTTHSAMAEETRRQAGITPGLVRMSVGIEPLEAILQDVFTALARRPVAKFDTKPAVKPAASATATQGKAK